MRSITYFRKTVQFPDKPEKKRFFARLQNGDWEPCTFQNIERLVDRKTTFIDIGGWIGVTPYWAAQIADNVITVEPDPVCFGILKEMQPGDEALFYHSGKQKAAVGVMAITRAWKPDGADGMWASVRVEPREPLAKPVTLADIKAEPKLAKLEMLRQSRLSVTPVRDDEWKLLLKMAN